MNLNRLFISIFSVVVIGTFTQTSNAQSQQVPPVTREYLNLVKCIAGVQADNQIWRELTGKVMTSFTVDGLKKKCASEIEAEMNLGVSQEQMDLFLFESLDLDRWSL